MLAVGRPDEVGHHPAAARAHIAKFPHALLIPGLVNAHAHLDLTDVGPRPFEQEGGFMGWIEMVRRNRPADEASIARSVGHGAELSLAGGTVAIGDIAGAPGGRPGLAPFQALARSDLVGTSFLEFFAIGRGEEPGLARARAVIESAPAVSGGVRLGLQPHAPNTVSGRGYEWAAGCGLPLATHLAETDAEREFIAHARGPQRQFLERIGLWDQEMLGWLGHGLRPVQHLAPVLEQARFILAHVNDAADEDIALLARTGQSVAYCPRASEYFQATRGLGAHRYRDMLQAGIPLALGTDSIINLPVAGGESPRISILDEMRLLWRRDRTDPGTLLAMATQNGAAALGLEPAHSRFVPGEALLGIVAVDLRGTRADDPPLERALGSDGAPTLLLAGK